MLKVKEKVTSFWQNHDLEKFVPYEEIELDLSVIKIIPNRSRLITIVQYNLKLS